MQQDGHDIGLFISSSNNRLDVVRQVIKSFDVCWADCPFAKFVGLNSAVDAMWVRGFHPIYTPVYGWRAEVLEQILHLPEQIEYILLFLDDFLILSPVHTERLQKLLDEALHRDIEYLRLVPIRRAALPRLARRIFRGSGPEVEPVGVQSPYYSSLQVALWKRTHLIDMLRLDGRHIWEFEHQKIPGHPHFAIVGDPPIQYVHVIEKGKWQPYSQQLFRRLNLPFDAGDRTVSGREAYLALWLNRIKFEIVGYSVMRFKKYWHQKWDMTRSE